MDERVEPSSWGKRWVLRRNWKVKEEKSWKVQVKRGGFMQEFKGQSWQKGKGHLGPCRCYHHLAGCLLHTGRVGVLLDLIQTTTLNLSGSFCPVWIALCIQSKGLDCLSLTQTLS